MLRMTTEQAEILVRHIPRRIADALTREAKENDETRNDLIVDILDAHVRGREKVKADIRADLAAFLSED